MSNRVKCEVEEVEICDDGKTRGRPGVEVTCSRCDHVVQSFGTSESSIKRCFALLREECPQGESNFYVEDD